MENLPIEKSEGVKLFTEEAARLAVEKNISFSKAAAELIDKIMKITDLK